MNENNMEIIKDFNDEYEDNVSQIILFKKVGRGEKYHNLYNGKSSNKLEKVLSKGKDYTVISSGRMRQGLVDITYDEKRELLLVIMYVVNALMPSEGVTRTPEEYGRYYIDKDKNFILKNWEWKYENNIWKRVCSENYYKVENGYGIGILPFKIKDYPLYRSKAMDEIYKIFPKYVTLSGNRLRTLDNLGNLSDFLKYKEPKSKEGPIQNEIDRLVKIKLEDINTKEITSLAANDTFAVVSRVGDEPFCVLRSFIYNKDENEIFEGGRIYIGKTKVYPCKKCNNGAYIRTSLLTKQEHWNFPIETFDAKVTEGTKLEYFGSNIENIDINNRGLAVLCFLKWDLYEKLFKSEFKDFMEEALKSSGRRNVMEYFEQIFGGVSKDKNMYKAIGLNKYQAKKVLDDLKNNPAIGDSYSLSPILITKIIIGRLEYYNGYRFLHNHENTYVMINDINNETFDIIYDLSKRISCDLKQYYTRDIIVNCFSQISILYGLDTVIRVKDDVLSLAIEDESKNHYYNNLTIRIYNDYFRMVSMLNDTVNFKPYFKNREDIRRMHDAAVALANLRKNEYEKTAFMTYMKKWSKWEYEDENYIVKAPKEPEELAKEGMELHHCVKSYISKVANGSTNIMFIRKKEEPDKPFFTVEIGNNNKIEQIHGSCNRNISSEPDMLYFVNDWCKARKLSKNNINKVR